MFDKEIKNPQDSIAWSELKIRREEVRSFYSNIFKVPIIYGTKNKLFVIY